MSPPNLPIKALLIIKNGTKAVFRFELIIERSNRGAIFWGTTKRVIDCQVNPGEIETTHWWRGAEPIFRSKAVRRINLLIWGEFFILDILNKIPTEAVAWVIKYFSLASVWYFLSFLNIKGTNAIRLTSKATQVINHLEEEIIRIIDLKSTVKKSNIEGCRKIIM